MVNSSTKMFYISRRNKSIGVLALISIGALLSVSVVMGNELGFLLLAIEVIAVSLVIWMFTAKLEISDSGIKYSDSVLITSANWGAVEKITNKGLLARSPEITFRRWAVPFVYRSPHYLFRGESIRWAPESVRTIRLRYFENNWPHGEIGEELQKYIPDLFDQH